MIEHKFSDSIKAYQGILLRNQNKRCFKNVEKKIPRKFEFGVDVKSWSSRKKINIRKEHHEKKKTCW